MTVRLHPHARDAVEEGNAWLVITIVVKFFGERQTHS